VVGGGEQSECQVLNTKRKTINTKWKFDLFAVSFGCGFGVVAHHFLFFCPLINVYFIPALLFLF
jgi:hypothetical protein